MDNNTSGGTPDLGELVSRITSNPDMMKQIAQLAGAFKSDITEPEDVEAITNRPEEEAIATIAPLEARREPDRRPPNAGFNEHAKLFHALKPYLNPDRREKLEYILQLFNIITLLEASGINIGNLFQSPSRAASVETKPEE